MSQFRILLCLTFCGLAPALGRAGEPSGAAQSGVILNPVAERASAEYAETLERPLFATNRRPIQEKPVIAPVPQPIPPDPPANLVLAGVLSTSKGMIALVSLPQSSKFVQAKVGDEVSNWKIIAIDPQRMVAQQGVRRLELAMFRMDDHGLPPNMPVAQLAVPGGQASRGPRSSGGVGEVAEARHLPPGQKESRAQLSPSAAAPMPNTSTSP